MQDGLEDAREAELKHRMAMLAALGFSFGEVVQDCGSFMNHCSASNAEELAMDIVATLNLAMGQEMFHEYNTPDMESLAELNQSIAVFAASGNKSTCWSQESTDYMMGSGMRQNHGQDHASAKKHEPAIGTVLGFRIQSAYKSLYGCVPDPAW